MCRVQIRQDDDDRHDFKHFEAGRYRQAATYDPGYAHDQLERSAAAQELGGKRSLLGLPPPTGVSGVLIADVSETSGFRYRSTVVPAEPHPYV